MSHREQKEFCKWVKKLHPQYFKNVDVVDVGSLDINGNNRGLFGRSRYVGVDIVNGYNVDVVGYAHEVLHQIEFKERTPVWNHELSRIEEVSYCDVTISTEALEHDKFWHLTLRSMYDKLRPLGLMIITCGGVGRSEHGTYTERPEDSPGTNDHYSNISNRMFESVLPPRLFKTYYLTQDERNCDLQFFGIKY